MLLVEQDVRAALTISDRTCFLRSGRVILEESAEESCAREHWWDLF
jgi:ABC-type branched-subunit amino acid transport system ATPase component